MDSIFNDCCTDCTNTKVTNTIPNSISTSYDAFGRFRVSQPYTLFDSQNRYKLSDKFYSNTFNSGSVTYSNVDSVVSLNVTTSSNSFSARESKYVFTYQPGKSLLIMNTFVFNAAQAGLVQRVGYFGPDNGYFLELSSSNLSIVERSRGTDTRVLQTNWNVDKLNGAGSSKVTLDITKSQIFFLDIEWLGVGSVRSGFVINGNFIVCHTFNHANLLSNTYMTTACLPVRYEIRNTDSISGTLKQICSTVISEGGYEPKEQLFCAIGPAAGTTLSSTLIPVCSIRLASGRLDAIVQLKQLNIAVNTNNDLSQWQLIINGTLTGATFAASTGGSTNVEVDTAASAISGGRVIETGFAQTGSINTMLNSTYFEGQIGRNSFTSTSDILTLCLVGLSSNPKTFWSIAWSEVV